MAISAQTALAIGISVLGHTGILIAATQVPHHAHAPRPPVEIAIVTAKPHAMGESASGGATVMTPALTVSRPSSRLRALTQPSNEATEVVESPVAPPSAETRESAVAVIETLHAGVVGGALQAVGTGSSGTTQSADNALGSGSGAKAGLGGDGSSVSAKPRYRTNPPPEYPVASRRRHEQGTVWLRVTVTQDGRAADVAVERTCGYASLDDSARDAVRTWAFDAAVRDGVRIDSSVLVPVRFALDH